MVGTITKQTISGAFSFPVGDFNGYTPLDVANATGGGDFTVTAQNGPQPTLDPAKSLGEYWTLNANGSVTLDLTFNYLPADVNGNEANYRIIRVENGTAVTFGSGVPQASYDAVSHKATLTGVSQFSDWTLGESVTPTAVDLDSFTATSDSNGTLLQWQTGFEVNNLGFNIYRQVNGERTQINPSLIVGSALMVGQGTKLQSGYGYSWRDKAVDYAASYWLEDFDIDGTSTWHGPFGVTGSSSGKSSATQSILLSDLNSLAVASQQRKYPAGVNVPSNVYGPVLSQTNGRNPQKASSISQSLKMQWGLASQPALKIGINKPGWYKMNVVDLAAAGMDININPDDLQMFAGGVEIPIRVNTRNGRFSSDDSIEFYGTNVDTTSTDTQIYWLALGTQPGKRINIQQSPVAGNNFSGSFLYTVERKDRSLYFSSLRNGDKENSFGQIVNQKPASLNLSVHHLDQGFSGQAQLEIALQGVSTAGHQVTVMLNGGAIHSIAFSGLDHSAVKVSIPESSLVEGDNAVTLMAENSGDISLVDYVRITYAHNYAADANKLFLSQTGGQPVQVTGFTSNQIRAIDVANPNQPVEVQGTIEGDNGIYSISIGSAKRRNLVVFTADQMLQPLSIGANQPSSLNKGGTANFVIITQRDLAQSVQPFAAYKQSQGYQVAVVDVEDIYDEFSYGVHTPQAVKDFLNWTYLHWQTQPQYVLLAGSGSLDPRNYTGLGNTDLVPVKLIDTSSMEAASDDWFVDFDNDGRPQMSIGRLPVRTAADATNLVNKIISYEQSGNADSAVLVSDISDNADFNAATSQIKALIPPQMKVVNIVRGQQQTDAKTELMDQLTQGGKIVNYAGHGSVNLWRGNLLTNGDVQSLANTKVSPLVVTMTCLNAYFMDPRAASLGETFIRVPKGGAVSVWASSAMTDTGAQSIMNRVFFRQLFSGNNITLGQAIREAKATTFDDDVRRTWILLGDPTMKIIRK